MTKFQTIDEYIAAQPEAIAQRLSSIREVFHSLVPETQESIRYELPAFTVGNDHLYISAYKKHIGMYPMYGIAELNHKMEPYRGKGTKDALHFKHTEPLPYELIEEIIKAKENANTFATHSGVNQVNHYIAQFPDWQKERLSFFRTVIHDVCPTIEENFKWNVPVFLMDGRLLFAMSAFKAHVKLNFIGNGALLDDPNELFNNGFDSKKSRGIDMHEADTIDEVQLKALIQSALRDTA